MNVILKTLITNRVNTERMIPVMGLMRRRPVEGCGLRPAQAAGVRSKCIYVRPFVSDRQYGSSARYKFSIERTHNKARFVLQMKTRTFRGIVRGCFGARHY